jgi:hypothetical protein
MPPRWIRVLLTLLLIFLLVVIPIVVVVNLTLTGAMARIAEEHARAVLGVPMGGRRRTRRRIGPAHCIWAGGVQNPGPRIQGSIRPDRDVRPVLPGRNTGDEGVVVATQLHGAVPERFP